MDVDLETVRIGELGMESSSSRRTEQGVSPWGQCFPGTLALLLSSASGLPVSVSSSILDA